MMVENSLKAFSETFHSDISIDAQALEMLKEHSFVDKMGEILSEYGEINECVPCHWKSKGFKIDAYELDEDFSNLTLIVSYWLDKSDPDDVRVTNSQIEKIFKRGLNFFIKSLEGKLENRIDVSNPAQELSGLIYECRKEILSVKLILITDGVTQERRAETSVIEGIEIKKVIWDIQRVDLFVQTGEREQISIDFESDYGGAITCVREPSPMGKYTTYLAFIPGSVLADLYADWKIRLLERNVRVFLSHRPKVNQGIRDTIRNEPDMFCAYNNGITVYAQDIKIVTLPSGNIGISNVTDFQIVNGGQTTASLYHTREKFGADISSISIQMKLMLIHEDARPADLPEDQNLADVLVPKIGRYSNTQNKIQMADLLANDPPHPELHAISKLLAAPDPTGGSVQSFWFYEKSRGSYEETRRLQAKTIAQKKKFDQKFPKRQRFDKNKFGKAWNSYRQRPHIVCLGAMKNFAHFNTWLQELNDEDWPTFYRKTVALILIWNEAERLVRRQKFGGYTHAIVAHTLAWLHFLTDMKIDLEKIWHEQILHDTISSAILELCIVVNDHIRNTNLNVTEWCKKEECWIKLKEEIPYSLPDIENAFISTKSQKKYKTIAASEAQNITFCKKKGSKAWWALASWLKERAFMSGKQRSQCGHMGRILGSGKEPSEVLSYACKNIWMNAEESYGWRSPEDGNSQ